MAQRDTPGAMTWYKGHTNTAQIGWNPNGMCQKICRTARNIGGGYASALAQQIGTPQSKRVYKISDITQGMVMFFDDPDDSNPHGHIVTVVGHKAGEKVSSLSSILVKTNSVKSGQIVTVTADFFPKNWGDKFQFAGTEINGTDLLLPSYALGGTKKPPVKKTTPPKKPSPVKAKEESLDRMRYMVKVYDHLIWQERKNKRVVTALKRDRAKLQQTIWAVN
jgi:hypothetical protein